MFRLSCKLTFCAAAFFVFVGGQSAQAAPTSEIVVRLYTTNEAKEAGEKVTIIVERAGEVIAKKELGQGKIKTNDIREIPIPFTRVHEIKGMKIKIVKEGTKPWEFQVAVRANKHYVYESKHGLIKFRGKDRNHILLMDNVHEVWLDLKD